MRMRFGYLVAAFFLSKRTLVLLPEVLQLERQVLGLLQAAVQHLSFLPLGRLTAHPRRVAVGNVAESVRGAVRSSRSARRGLRRRAFRVRAGTGPVCLRRSPPCSPRSDASGLPLSCGTTAGWARGAAGVDALTTSSDEAPRSHADGRADV